MKPSAKLTIGTCFLFLIIFSANLNSQADNEIQVYASSTIGNKMTIIELHSNYTINGSNNLSDPESARWLNESLEVTSGFGDHFEIGFYLFTAFNPDGDYQFLGSQIRPRISVPTKLNWPFGASLSAEIGFSRPDENIDYEWGGEIRPIIDKEFEKWYFSFNPNIAFSFGDNGEVRFAPQWKTYGLVSEKFALGFEYYSDLGKFSELSLGETAEHLIGPTVDLFLNPRLEFNFGLLFGLNDQSNQEVLKLLLGYRLGG